MEKGQGKFLRRKIPKPDRGGALSSLGGSSDTTSEVSLSGYQTPIGSEVSTSVGGGPTDSVTNSSVSATPREDGKAPPFSPPSRVVVATAASRLATVSPGGYTKNVSSASSGQSAAGVPRPGGLGLFPPHVKPNFYRGVFPPGEDPPPQVPPECQANSLDANLHLLPAQEVGWVDFFCGAGECGIGAFYFRERDE